jgi:hypothetical protein
MVINSSKEYIEQASHNVVICLLASKLESADSAINSIGLKT